MLLIYNSYFLAYNEILHTILAQGQETQSIDSVLIAYYVYSHQPL